MTWAQLVTAILSDPTVQALESEIQHQLLTWIISQLGAAGANQARAHALKAEFLKMKGIKAS